MLSALVIVFREILEAGLIIGIVWSMARSLAGARSWILGGITAGILGSAVVAVFTGSIANAFAGYGQEIFNASVLAIAVVMLAWHSIWMAQHGKAMVSEMRQAGQDVAAGRRSFWALALIVGMAVLREGSEVVLFLYGVAVSGGETAAALFAGGMLGLAAGALVSFLTFKGLLSIPLRYFFSVTNWLIILLAAGMAAQSMNYLEKAGLVSVLGETVWDSSWLLSENGMLGRVLHTLIGYADQPSAAQLLTYLCVIAIIWFSTFYARKASASANRLASA